MGMSNNPCVSIDAPTPHETKLGSKDSKKKYMISYLQCGITLSEEEIIKVTVFFFFQLRASDFFCHIVVVPASSYHSAFHAQHLLSMPIRKSWGHSTNPQLSSVAPGAP